MQYDLFADQELDLQTPFTNRIVCMVGSFRTSPKQIAKKLCEMGADCKPSTKISRNVHYVLVGDNPPSDQMEYLRTLNFHGFYPRILNEKDYHNICKGHYASYQVPEEIEKTLHLTLQHFLTSHPTLRPGENQLYTHEFFVAADTCTPQNVLFQQLGDRGIYANGYMDDTTDYLVISEASLQHLQEGNTDSTLQYIEQQYNASHTQTYRYAMLSEQELLDWLNASTSLENTNTTT